MRLANYGFARGTRNVFFCVSAVARWGCVAIAAPAVTDLHFDAAVAECVGDITCDALDQLTPR